MPVYSQDAASVPAEAEAEPGATELTEEEAYMAWALEIWESLSPQRGEVELPNGVATLTVPEEFYYLNAADSEKVLVEVWGNPPGAGIDSLGMLFPSDFTPFDSGSWR